MATANLRSQTESQDKPAATGEKPAAQGGLVALVGRFTWAFAGPMALALTACLIIERGGGWLTRMDAAFGVIVALMLAGRWIEQACGRATTLKGEPSDTRRTWRYTLVLVPASALIWAAVNLLGNYILG